MWIVGLIAIVVLLSFCINGVEAIDDNATISNSEDMVQVNNSTILFEGDNKSTITIKENDELHYDVPTISVRSKPSCQSCHRHMPYKWFVRSWKNYCPHCHRYNSLIINPKRVYEVEITCKNCDSDYCGVCGHDKCANYYRHRNYYLKEA